MEDTRLKDQDSPAGGFPDKLAALRKAIDGIDDRLLALFNERARLAQEVGKVKNRFDTEYYIPSREKEVLKRVRGGNAGPLPDEAISANIVAAAVAFVVPLSAIFASSATASGAAPS